MGRTWAHYLRLYYLQLDLLLFRPCPCTVYEEQVFITAIQRFRKIYWVPRQINATLVHKVVLQRYLSMPFPFIYLWGSCPGPSGVHFTLRGKCWEGLSEWFWSNHVPTCSCSWCRALMYAGLSVSPVEIKIGLDKILQSDLTAVWLKILDLYVTKNLMMANYTFCY